MFLLSFLSFGQQVNGQQVPTVAAQAPAPAAGQSPVIGQTSSSQFSGTAPSNTTSGQDIIQVTPTYSSARQMSSFDYIVLLSAAHFY